MSKIAQQVTTYQVMLSIRKKFTNDLHVRLQVGVRQEELIPASVRSPGNHPWVWINTRPDSGPRPSLRVRTAGFVVEPGTKLGQLDRSSVLSHLLWAVKPGWGEDAVSTKGRGEDAGKEGKRTRRKLSSSFSNTGCSRLFSGNLGVSPITHTGAVCKKLESKRHRSRAQEEAGGEAACLSTCGTSVFLGDRKTIYSTS